MLKRKALGWIGEQIALGYLRRSFYAIWDKNWRCEIGEIDILALQNRTLHIVEVKTRIIKGNYSYSTLDQLTEKKQKKLQELSRYLLKNKRLDLRRRRVIRAQIDFIGITITINRLFPRYTINHIPHIVAIIDARYGKLNDYREHLASIS